MERNYTEAVRDGFFDLIERDTNEIWKNHDLLSADLISSGKFKDYFRDVISKYSFSCRFAIMRILFEKATGLPPTKVGEEALANGFSVAGIGAFPDISIQHAEEMTDEEVGLYKRLLLHRVEENNPDYWEEAADLINRALALPPVGTKSYLSRAEIIRLCHMVDFSFEDTQFILLRVLEDNEVGFRYSSSMDLIDMYGFMTHTTLSEVEELKLWYRNNTVGIKKIADDEKVPSQTQDVQSLFGYAISTWAPENRTDEFKAWLRQQSPYLDLKSKSARKVYINLVTYAYSLVKPKHFRMSDFSGENFYGDMEALALQKSYHDCAVHLLFSEMRPDSQKCNSVASVIINENSQYARGFGWNIDNNELLYHVLHVEKGKITARGKLNKNSKQRIVDILMDVSVPTKSDLLFLLWLIANCHWIAATITSDEKVRFLDDFLASASCLLEAADLPEFYPPCLLERAIMLSLALGNDENSPAEVYESICRTFTDKGHAKKQTGDTRKTPEEKREIAAHYYKLLAEHPSKKRGYKKDCQKACVEHFLNRGLKVSISSIENYCKEFPEDKL